MSKELEALKQVDFAEVNIGGNSTMPFYKTKQYEIIETALKSYEELLKIEYKQITINDFYKDTKSVIDDLLNIVYTKIFDVVKQDEFYTKDRLLEIVGFAIRYVKTFAYGQEFNETQKIGVREKKLKALEIIKEKKVNLEYLKCCETYEQYKTICSYWNELTQKEYNLLKEVLS